VEDESGRSLALEVMRATYRDEKGWLAVDDKLVPPDEMGRDDISWHVVRLGLKPIGVVRVLYEPPLDLYREYGFKLVGEFDLDTFISENRIAEIGRFAVLPGYRKNVRVAATLMRAACKETVEREYTHYITDVFEGETHSPYEFHTRIMGFQVVATHDVGELNCPNRRITLILDLRAGYRRLASSRSWLFRYLTEGWDERLRVQMQGGHAGAPAQDNSRREEALI
jgi:hypothetical protein